MRRKRHYKYISVNEINILAKIFNNIFQEKRDNRRGRPPKYSDEFILTLFFLKTARGFSYRVLRVECKDLFGGKAPALSTLHYRFKNIDTEKLRAMVSLFGFLIEDIGDTKREYTFCDGTGFGFEEKVSLRYSRGKERRDVKGHVKVELLVAGTMAGDYVIAVRAAPL